MFADSGEVASTATVAVPYKNKLLISGEFLFSPSLTAQCTRLITMIQDLFRMGSRFAIFDSGIGVRKEKGK